MGGAGGSDVKNAVWMRALVMAGMILGLSIAAYVTLGVVAADMKHQTWTDEKADYAEAKNAYDEAVDADITVENNSESPIFVDYGNAYNDKVDAHLSYLTYRVAGLAILFVGIIFTAFMAISGLLNSSRPDEDHDEHHGHDEHEHHGSASPIIFSFGCLLFLLGFPEFADGLHGLMMGSSKGTIADLSVSMIGLTVVTVGVANWWREDLPFNGYGEQLATSDPFNGQHIRKAGIWVFLMSEVMVFATFFSSYLRMRTEWCTKWAQDDGKCSTDEPIVLTASDYLRPGGGAVDKFGESVGDFWTMLPGAVNTFALIISSTPSFSHSRLQSRTTTRHQVVSWANSCRPRRLQSATTSSSHSLWVRCLSYSSWLSGAISLQKASPSEQNKVQSSMWQRVRTVFTSSLGC